MDFDYPIENMPVVLRVITFAVPARYFVEILKGLFLEGVALMTLAVRRVGKTLD